MTKTVIAMPLMYQVPVSWFMNWLQIERDHVIGHCVTEAIYLPDAMATLVEQTFTQWPDFDRITVLEHDMIVPPDGVSRQAQYGYEHDIVGCVYVKHEWPHHCMAWMETQSPFYSPLTAETLKLMVDNPGLYEVDAVAMGFTSIARHVFEDWNPDVPMWKPPRDSGLVGHDLWFCHAAKMPVHGPNRDRAFKVWLDSGIGCGHLTLVPISYRDSQAALARANPPRWTEGGVPTGTGGMERGVVHA